MELFIDIDAAGASANGKPQGQTLETQSDRGFLPSDRGTTEVAPFDFMASSPLKKLENHILDKENRFTVKEEEKIQENDLQPNPTSPKEIHENHILNQVFEDDSIIPSPELKHTSKLPFFGSDLVLALQKIGINYNNLLKKHQGKNSEPEIMPENCELLFSKCLEECEPIYEALENNHNEGQHLISEIELLRAKCEALSNKYATLKEILAEETTERKRLYNELIELRGNIRVFCRCRPLSAEETSKGINSVIEFDPSKDTELQITCADSSKKIFKFDHVFGPKDDQEAVFVETLPIVKSVMDGFNGCIFAYGQTGTGKTFTMDGTPECRGVNYRSLEELFKIVKERMAFMRYEFLFSMLEVHNDKIRDLLSDNPDVYGKKLDIKQSAEGTQEIPGLIEVQVYSIDEVWEMLQSGGRNRSVGSTNANELSSRSHLLVRVTIKGENLVKAVERSKSFLWLVDLAGSERVGKIEAEGERLKESQFINKSLSALGDVISSLASKNSHIPYRNSKLTHLLQSSLGGDCKTLMFAQISPSFADFGETLCTLNFASRVRGVEHGGPAKKHVDPADSFKFKQMVEKLRHEEKEVSRLNESLQMMLIKHASRENTIRSLQEKESLHVMKIKALESQLAEEKARTQAATKEMTRSFLPPFAPSKQRPPLTGITNYLPPLIHRHITTTAKASLENKENAYPTIKDISTGITTKHFGKARRISISPIYFSKSKNKRRATINTELEALPTLSTKLSKLRVPRRRSVATLIPSLQQTPKGKGKFISSSSFRYSSPSSQLQHTLWKPRIPNRPSPSQLQTFWKSRLHNRPSPLQQQSRIFSSGAGSSSQNKFRHSIPKGFVMASRAQARSSILLEPRFRETTTSLQGKEITGRYDGTARRVLNKNRRTSDL